MNYKKIKLGEVASIDSGQGAPKDNEFSETGLPFIRAGHLEKLIDNKKLENIPKVNRQVSTKYRYKIIPKGTILFAKSGMSSKKNRIYKTTQSAYYVNHLASIIPLNNLDEDYLRYFLKWFRPGRLAINDSYPSIRLKDIVNLKIPLPPLPVQQKIAGILDRADRIRQFNKRILEKYDQLAQSVFLEMFGDLNLNLKGFTKLRFDEIVKYTQLGLVRSTKEQGASFQYSYLKMNNLLGDGNVNLNNVVKVNANPSEVKNYSLDYGDFLFNTRNSKELVGKTGVFIGNDRMLFNNNILRVKFNKQANSIYINYVFQTKSIKNELNKRKSGTTTVFAIYYKDLRTIKFPVPQIELQIKFANVIELINKQKQKIELEIVKADKLFESLLQRAFRGELV